MTGLLERLLPIGTLVLLLAGWEAAVVVLEIRPFLLPAPSAIGAALLAQAGLLLPAAWHTLSVSLIALVAATSSGMLLALAFNLSRQVERAFFPIAVLLQVTPIVSIAPLILIWVGIDHVDRALVIIAWLAGFFPILANLTAGLKAVDPQLSEVFALYRASRWQRFRYLVMPTALPHLLAGLKISGGFCLIGAVVAEFVAGSGGAEGLAWRLMEAGFRLQTDTMFAALFLLAGLGVALFYLLSAFEWWLLRNWHPGFRDS